MYTAVILAFGLVYSSWATPKASLAGSWADINGKKVTILGDGKYVLMDYWASWCVPCRLAAPTLNKLIPEFPELRIVGVNVDEPEGMTDARKFVRMAALNFPSVINIPEAMTDNYGVESVPTLILLDPEGNEIKRWIGEPKGFQEKLRALIRGK